MSSCCLPQNNVYPTYLTVNQQQNEQMHRKLTNLENFYFAFDQYRNETMAETTAQLSDLKARIERLTPKITPEEQTKIKQDLTSFRNYMILALIGSVALAILGFTCSNPFLAALIITSGVIPAVLSSMMISNLNDQINDIVI